MSTDVGFVMPPAYVEPAPTPTSYVQPPAYVDPYASPVLAFNPDVTRLPAPIQTDTNPVQTMFMIGNGTATIISPPVIPQPTSLDPPDPTLPVLPPPLPTSLPTLPTLP